MTTNIAETLPWTDYGELFAKAEEHGKAEGRAEGKAEGIAEGEVKGIAKRDMEIAMVLYVKHKPGTDCQPIIQMLKDIGISDDIIETARKQYESN